jgi:hypothetical protein
MAVEVPAHDAVERVVSEGECECIALDEPGPREPRRGDLEHARALVQPGDLAVEMPREEPRPAGDVERGRGGELAEHGAGRGDVVGEPGSVSFREQADAQVPVVVLGRAVVVVRRCGRLAHRS